MTIGTERSSVLSGRRKEKALSKHVAVESSKPVRQPLGMMGMNLCHWQTELAIPIPVDMPVVLLSAA